MHPGTPRGNLRRRQRSRTRGPGLGAPLRSFRWGTGAGHRAVAACPARGALEHAAAAAPGSIDPLLCALLMPCMDGNELVRRAKELHPTLPALITSGTVSAYDRAGRADV